MNTTTTQRNIAKTALIEALKKSRGDTKNKEVVAAIEVSISQSKQRTYRK